jgi:hypothetical protein
MRIARDLRLTQGELQELARKAPNAADLLLKMLVALHVALENTDPHVMRDLRRLCTTCGAKKRCEHELADGTAGDHFREFCPNAFTLDALLEGSILGVNNRAQSHAWSTIMTKSARIADLERLEDDIDEALLHCPNDDSQMFVELRRRQSHLKEEIERLRHEVLGDRTLH